MVGVLPSSTTDVTQRVLYLLALRIFDTGFFVLKREHCIKPLNAVVVYICCFVINAVKSATNIPEIIVNDMWSPKQQDTCPMHQGRVVYIVPDYFPLNKPNWLNVKTQGYIVL